MARSETMQRAHPLAGKAYGGALCAVNPAAEGFRMSLRAPGDSVAALSKALGVPLPTKPKSYAAKGTRHALWLGPDEWLVIDETSNPVDDVAKVKALHSAVDISHRNTALIVSGTGAVNTVSAGCPQDLSEEMFPVGACSRTILGKIEIVLYRTKRDEFRVECWRSFSEYAYDFLSTAAKDCG